MVWTWISVIILLGGAELNAEIEHQTARDLTTGPPKPMGQWGAVMADTVKKLLATSDPLLPLLRSRMVNLTQRQLMQSREGRRTGNVQGRADDDFFYPDARKARHAF